MTTMEEIRMAARTGGVRPLDIVQAMGRLFPCLAENQWWAQPGARPLTIDDIDPIRKQARQSHQMRHHAVNFCLGVYNYNKNKFDFINAMGEMNVADRAVILQWAEDPFYL